MSRGEMQMRASNEDRTCSGRTIISWKVVGDPYRSRRTAKRADVSSQVAEPIRIAVIDVIGPCDNVAKTRAFAGVAFSDSCTACPAGTFSSRGAHFCTPCPPDSHAPHSGSEMCARPFGRRPTCSCTPCPSGEFAGPRAIACVPKPPCDADDYYRVWHECAHDGLLDVTYHWASDDNYCRTIAQVEPHVCSTSLSSSVVLPPTRRQGCPTCSRGMHKTSTSNGVCTFCDKGYVSDGATGPQRKSRN